MLTKNCSVTEITLQNSSGSLSELVIPITGFICIFVRTLHWLYALLSVCHDATKLSHYAI